MVQARRVRWSAVARIIQPPAPMIKTKRWNDPAEPGDGFRLLVCRYSGGDDVFILTPSASGNTLNGINGVGMDGFNDPTDIIEDPRTGNLYVCQLGTDRSGSPRNLITLLKPQQTKSAAIVSSSLAAPSANQIALPVRKELTDDVTPIVLSMAI